MIKKLFILLIILILNNKGISQSLKPLNVPPGWTTESFKLPPSFATVFPFKGTEDAVFSPEWAIKKTPGYWTYCFRWSLHGSYVIDKASLENALRIYYSRLVISNLKIANIDSSYAIPVKVKLATTYKLTEYTGTVSMLDYMTQDPIILNIRIKQKDKNTLFLELSPLAYTDKVWAAMDGVIL